MNNKKDLKIVEILLVEDNPADIRLTQEAIKESKISNNLHIVRDGMEAISFLRKEGKFSNAVRPDLILLDLNLPKINGFEVLNEIKNDSDLKRIPVVILTISEAEVDLVKAYNNYANCYVNKPLDIKEFYKIVKSIGNFWFTVVKLPDGV